MSTKLCATCGRPDRQAQNYLLECSVCKLNWHHLCQNITDKELAKWLIADAKRDHLNGTKVWKCRQCTRRAVTVIDDDDSDDDILFVGQSVVTPATTQASRDTSTKPVIPNPAQHGKSAPDSSLKRAPSTSSLYGLGDRQKRLKHDREVDIKLMPPPSLIPSRSTSTQPLAYTSNSLTKTERSSVSLPRPSSIPTRDSPVIIIDCDDDEAGELREGTADDDDDLYRMPTPNTSRANMRLLQERARLYDAVAQRNDGPSAFLPITPSVEPSVNSEVPQSTSDGPQSMVTSTIEEDVGILSDKLATWWIQERHKRQWKRPASQRKRGKGKHVVKATKFDGDSWFPNLTRNAHGSSLTANRR